MKRLRLYVRAFFGFSRMETNGFLILMPLVLILLFSEPVYRTLVDPEPLTGLDRTDSLLAWMASQERVKSPASLDSIVFHSFDPNQITREGLVALGLNDRTAERMVSYRSKGGRFRRKVDVGKIYGMDSSWLKHAGDWMKFPKEEIGAARQQPRKKRLVLEDINTTDTLRLQDVYGIGPALARRIVTFRDRLGGFVFMEQLRDVYGLDSVVVERVKRQFEVKPGFEPRMLNLQKATYDEIIQHPYISRRQAQAIVAYRKQHDGLDSLEQLVEIKVLDGKWLSKVRPYLTFR